MKGAEQLAFPLRVLERIADHDKVLEVVDELFASEPPGYVRMPERRIDLIKWFREWKGATDDEVIPRVTPYVADFDENVRFTAIEGLGARDPREDRRAADRRAAPPRGGVRPHPAHDRRGAREDEGAARRPRRAGRRDADRPARRRLQGRRRRGQEDAERRRSRRDLPAGPDPASGVVHGAPMPRRKDLESILIIGSGPIVIGQACEFDYSGTQACKALREEGCEVVLVNSNPATIMTDPELADATYVEPLDGRGARQGPRAREAERDPADARRPDRRSTSRWPRARRALLEKHGVELLGATVEAIEKAEDRELFKQAMARIGLACPRRGSCTRVEEARGVIDEIGFPAILRPSLHAGRLGRRHRVQPRRVRRDGRSSALEQSPDARDPRRGERARLEGVRARGHARRDGQRRHRLLDREPRSDGRAHRRLDHGRAGDDADRQGVPAHARRLDRDHARDRRRRPAARTSSSRSTRRPAACS